MTARKLEHIILQQANIWLAYRLALDLSFRGFSTYRLENYVAQAGSPKLIYKFASDIYGARVERLEKAIINLGSILWIAKFGCSVRGADRKRIEKLIIKDGNAQAAFLFIKNVHNCNVSKLKNNILKSNKSRYLFALAKISKSKKDIELIQDKIIASNCMLYIRMFAEQIAGADILKLEQKVLQTMDPKEIKKFADSVGSEKALRLSLLC